MGCKHSIDGVSTWSETGTTDAGREYMCTLCSQVHLPSDEEILTGRFYPDSPLISERDMLFKNPKLFEEALRMLFERDVFLIHKKVAHGSMTSSAIWLPREFRNYPATVLIWLKDKETL